MKFAKSAALAFGLLFAASIPALAQPGAATTAPAAAVEPAGPLFPTRGLGVGLVIVGAALGIGGLTKSAVESMARQPEMAAGIQTAMIISAALIEGVAFFALIILGFIIQVG